MKYIIYLACLLCAGCAPEYLEVKRDKSQTIPTTFFDFDAMLDNYSVFNLSSGHALGTMAADEYYVDENVLSLISSSMQRNAYIWADEIYEGQEVPDWNYSYKRILYANIILEGLERMKDSDKNDPSYGRIKGSALFHRAYAHFNVSQLFAFPLHRLEMHAYGIPLRLTSDPTQPSKRSTVAETYAYILEELKLASELLPEQTMSKFHPDKVVAFALLARINCLIEDHEQALLYAKKALEIHDELLDYNTINGVPANPFPAYGEGNPEVLFVDISNTATLFTRNRLRIFPEFYNTYDDDDLRKHLFFEVDNSDEILYRGSYRGSANLFSGIAVDELYLIKAESLVKANQVSQAMEVLNVLLSKRYRDGHFTPLAISNAREALDVILLERKKQLLLRGLRWSDLRKWNKYPEFALTVSRRVMDVTHQLLPESNKYTFPIPESVLLTSKITQNPQ